tara:strand:+ start:1079 stop:1663 length:585 start_codon:yes stop_codon:yes gene_type:complete
MKSFSQAGQDKFIITMLQNKHHGKYIEIGAFDPIQISNTYLLETEYEWTGFSLDIKEKYVNKFNLSRKNKCVLADGRTFDYHEYIKSLWGDIDRIDYLQVDCEPAENTYKCLCAVPLDKVRFSVITFETDYYACGDNIRKLSREKLNGYGYELVASDVCNENNPFEDWYVDPTCVDASIFQKYICSLKEGKDIC